MGSRLDGELTLWIAMILMGTGGVTTLVGSVVFSIYVVSPTAMAATILAPTITGALLLVLWSTLGRRTTTCAAILHALGCAGPAIAFFTVAAAGLAIAVALGGTSALHYFIGVLLLQAALWGLLQWRLYRAALGAMCLPAHTVSRFMAAGAHPGSKGLGDYVQAATKAMGIQPCAGCQERARRLNALTQTPKDR